jgi:hypothetical protein
MAPSDRNCVFAILDYSTEENILDLRRPLAVHIALSRALEKL